MTVINTTNRNDYVGTGTAGPFTYSFRIFDQADLVVTMTTVAGVTTTLVLTTDYTVAGVGLATGTVTLATTLPVGAALTIKRAPAQTQTTSLRNQGAYFPDVIENAFDRVVMMVQDVNGQVASSLRLPSTVSPAAFSLTIPTRPASGYVRVNTAGTALEAVTAVNDPGTFTQSGAGAVARSVTAKFGETLSVKDFGALGNGITDDSVAIQAALTAASVAGGADVYFPVGTYPATNLVLTSATPVMLRGAHRQSSVLKHITGSTTDLLTVSAPVTVDTLGFDGNAALQTTRRTVLALSANLYAVEVRNCYFTATANYGIKLIQVNKTVSVTGCLFKDLSEWPNVGPGTDVSVAIYLGSALVNTTGNIRIVDNDFINTAPVNNAPCGIQLAGDSASVTMTLDVIGNYFENFGCNRGGTQPSAPIDVYQFFEKVTIHGNRITKSGCGGIKIGQAGAVSVMGNTIRDDLATNTTAAIFWSGGVRDPANPSHNVVIAGNVIRRWAGYAGIHVVGYTTPNFVKRAIVANNVIDNCQSGVFIDMGRDFLMSENLISNCTGVGAEMAGIVIYRPQGVIVIRGGVIADNASYGILGDYFPNGGTVILDGITLHDNVGSHIRINDVANLVTLLQVRNCVTIGAMTNILQYATRLDVFTNNFAAGAPAVTGVVTYVHANNNFDLLQATNAAIAWGLIANGASAIVTTTVTGAVVGDFCFPSLSTDVGGLTLTAYCSGIDTVRTVVANLTGLGVTPSGSLYLTVIKRV